MKAKMNRAVVWFFCILALCNRIDGEILKWKNKFDVIESWEAAKLIKQNAKDQTNLHSNIIEFAALREQPVKEIRVKRDAYGSSGLGENMCKRLIDLGFLLDGSGISGLSSFRKILNFVKNLLDYFMISANKTRFSVISYASSPTLKIRFSETFATKQDRDSAIDAISYPGGETNTGGALDLAYNSMFRTSNGARSTSDVTKVLIVLTDGQSLDTVEQPAQRVKNDKVIIYSIGVGAGVSNTQLNKIASLPSNEHVFLLNNFEVLGSFASGISTTICKAQTYYLMCGSDNITLVIGVHSLGNLDMNNAHLLDANCKASHNQTHLFISTIQNQCGTTYTQTQQEIIYSNKLTIRRKSTSSVITREKEISIHFHCTYSRTVNISGVTFEPPNPVIEVTKGSLGNFTIELGSFANNQFSLSTSESYPAFKSFHDYINIQYKVKTANLDIVIRAQSCHATPTNKAYDTPQYPIITDFCDKDSTITHLTSGLQQTHQFRMQVFRFLADHTLVYIHCTLRLCNRNTQNSVCTRSTTCPIRARRDTASPDPTDQDFMVSLGPYMQKQAPKNDTNGDETNLTKNKSGQRKLCSSKTLILFLMVVMGLSNYHKLFA